jgi:hypothetical protein
LAVYNLDGDMEDFKELGTEFIFCPKSIADTFSFKSFGTNYENSCTINLNTVQKNYVMKFYELYLWDKVANNYVNIPIRLPQFLDGKIIPKKNLLNKLS